VSTLQRSHQQQPMMLLPVLGLLLTCAQQAPRNSDHDFAAAVAPPWMVGSFGACLAGPTTPAWWPKGQMAALRKFATLSFCTDPADAVRAHQQQRPHGTEVQSFLHLGLVKNSPGELIWNIKCERGGCGHNAPPGRKSGLLDGWEKALLTAIRHIGPALRNGTIQGIFLGKLQPRACSVSSAGPSHVTIIYIIYAMDQVTK
jgi:hypothetical protein